LFGHITHQAIYSLKFRASEFKVYLGETAVTNYWFVTHDLPSYRQEPDKIGRGLEGAKRDKVFKGIRKGDRVVYYAKKKIFAGIFKVVSDLYLSSKRVYGAQANRVYVYDLEPIFVLSTENPVQIDPADYGFEHKQRTVVKLNHEQYRNVVMDILGMAEPRSENGVISLFSKIHKELGFPFLKVVSDKFPDCIALNYRNKEIRLEFEKKSSDFEAHGHDPRKCDYIVCWTNDLGTLAPAGVIELREIIFGH